MSDKNEQTDSRDFNDVIKNYELLIKNTQLELDFYKSEQLKLKEEVLKVLQDNQSVYTEIQDLKNIKETNQKSQDHEQLTNDAITNLKSQINYLTEERQTLHSLWKTSQETVNNLEKEISNYREQILKPNTVSEIRIKYNETIQLLENTIKTFRHELTKQSDINKDLIRDKKISEQRIKLLETEIHEQKKRNLDNQKTDYTLGNYKSQLKYAMRTNNDLEKSLQQAQIIINERLNREREALDKVQEALVIAENAIVEKDAAFNRECIVREECDHLATTIGQVMEEAANKVENNIENIKAQYQQEINNVVESYNETKLLLENQKKINRIADIRIQTLEIKIKDVVKENITLDTDLQIASKAIIEMELKLEAIEHLLDYDKKSNKISQERELELRNFLLNNKQLKEKWKCAIEEVTNKLKYEISNLQKENMALKIENEDLRRRLKIFCN